jgi:DNA repair protein SbcD/Mre11
MRILHTADWHLNDRLGRIDRSDDLRAAVERVAVHCREQKADVLLVAGDLFSELARPDALRESIRHWQEVFADFLEGGGTILTCTGNHDNENFCQTLRHAMALAAPTVDRLGELVPTGRLYLAAEPTFLRLPDKAGGDVQFLLMPYPTPTRYLRGEGDQAARDGVREHHSGDAGTPEVPPHRAERAGRPRQRVRGVGGREPVPHQPARGRGGER